MCAEHGFKVREQELHPYSPRYPKHVSLFALLTGKPLSCQEIGGHILSGFSMKKPYESPGHLHYRNLSAYFWECAFRRAPFPEPLSKCPTHCSKSDSTIDSGRLS
jgi:hypothetical protein